MSTPEAVLFDLDGTLLNFDTSTYSTMLTTVSGELASDYGLDATALHKAHIEISLTRWNEVADGRFQPGVHDGAEILLSIWQEALARQGCTDPDAARRGNDAYWTARRQIFTLYEEALDVLDHLHGKVRLAVVTNGPEDMQIDKLEITGLTRYFDAVVTSGTIGVGKPDPAIFRTALDKIGASSPANSWHVGDNLTADIGGALATGLNAAWINRHALVRSAGHPQPHAEITSLRELLPLFDLE